MQTRVADETLDCRTRAETEAILRSCVHCGFCNATCPTYRLLGDERDGPRGRIYLIKQVMEGSPASERTQSHLDRCLTCRACETTCPSGVQYGRLLDIGRQLVEEQVARPLSDRTVRWALRAVLPYPGRLGPLWRLGRALRPVLPRSLKQKLLPSSGRCVSWPAPRHARTMLVLDGCVQAAVAPGINAAAADLLDRLGISLVAVSAAGCCGALSHHLAATEEARAFMRRNIDAWWPLVERGAEAVVLTASGCGVFVKDYGHLLRDDPVYAEKAERISAIASGLAEILIKEDVSELISRRGVRIACHSPCSLQHGQKLPGLLEALLRKLGFDLVPVDGAHLCCGSAGTYSLMHPDLSHQLLSEKIRGLEAAGPDLIVTDNIGCLMHLQSGTERPVRHWAEVLAEHLRNAEKGSKPARPEY